MIDGIQNLNERQAYHLIQQHLTQYHLTKQHNSDSAVRRTLNSLILFYNKTIANKRLEKLFFLSEVTRVECL